MRLAISLISIRDKESECVAEMRVAGGTITEAGVVSTLLTKGDFRGLSMLRPTKLHRGILKMCLHAASPGRKKPRGRDRWKKEETAGKSKEQMRQLTREHKRQKMGIMTEARHI